MEVSAAVVVSAASQRESVLVVLVFTLHLCCLRTSFLPCWTVPESHFLLPLRVKTSFCLDPCRFIFSESTGLI